METDDLNAAFEKLDASFCKLIPEVSTNIAYAKPGATQLSDVAAFPGRIRCALGKPSKLAAAEFGVSSHMARFVLEVIKHAPEKRCAMNLKYSEESVAKLKKMDLRVEFVDRRKETGDEPTMQWLAKQAVPDVLYDTGDEGKEPMIRIIAKNPEEAVSISMQLVKS